MPIESSRIELQRFPDFGKELRRPFEVHEICYDCAEFYGPGHGERGCDAWPANKPMFTPDHKHLMCLDFLRLPDVMPGEPTGQIFPPSRMKDRRIPRERCNATVRPSLPRPVKPKVFTVPTPQEQIAERRSSVPVLYRGIYARAMQGKSLRAAARAMCLECMHWDRCEVARCTDLACPLYAKRPYRGNQLVDTPERRQQIAERRQQIPRLYQGAYDRAVGGKSLRAAIRAFCLECSGCRRAEITTCPSAACPLYPRRPYAARSFPANPQNEALTVVESTNGAKRVSG